MAQLIKSGVVKNLVWTLPAIVLMNRFRADMYVSPKEMFTPRVSPQRLLLPFCLFTLYLLCGAVLTKGRLAVRPGFGLCDLIIVLFVGVTEETVFRGWLLNATLRKQEKWRAIFLNALMFLAIHFPVWLCQGTFLFQFQSLGFLSLLLLSVIFSWLFIQNKSIWVPVFFHMYWDLLILMLY